jgi:hypothetical protein
MQSERFRPLLTSHGPFGSVYFEDSHDTADAAAQIELKWRGLREELERQRAEPALIKNIEQAILHTHPAVGRGGRAVVAATDGVLVNEQLIRPLASQVVRVSTLPYILPLVDCGVEAHTYAVVAVDHAGGDIALHHNGRVATDTVDGGGYPVHKAAGANTPGYGDPQPRTEEARRKNVRAVADRVTELVDNAFAEVVFVVGEVRSRADLVAELPERVASRVEQLHIGARHSGFDDDSLRRAIDTEFQRRRLAAMDAAARRFDAELGRDSGMAAEGVPNVCAALRAGAVETLIIGDIGDATVLAGDDLAATVAPNADVLSELGSPPTQTLRADEALPLVAVSIGAALVCTDERITPAEGIGAVLRYPVR